MSRPTATETRVLVVDDHPFMRRGLAQTINDQPGMQVCGEAGSVAEALLLMESAQPHLAVVDISLGGSSGIDLIKAIREKWPDTKVLVSSMHDETLFAERSLRAGALGYVDKGAPPDAFVTALKRVNSGQVYLSDRMTGRMLDRVLTDGAHDQRSGIDKLSNRELQVFEMIGKGMVSKQIAAKLGLSPKTVETHREHIKGKLNLNNASELTRHAVQWVLEQGRR
ncbi:MAG: response regulator transcription factor [Planctomycetaceae bacterium]|nr:response regulator transcription factor [Planctomycetaceae bacterium]